jgi:hypothetical protein
MAASSKVTASDNGRVSVTVPPQHFERFHTEVLFDLSSAGDNLDEASRWARDEDKSATLRTESLIRVSTKELPTLHAVEQVWQQVDLAGIPDGDLTVTGDRKILRSTIMGCVLACGQAVHGAVEGRGTTVSRGRAAIAELAFWLDRLEEIGEEE